MILVVRTDNPTAEVGIFSTNTHDELAYEKWEAHRELESTLLLKIENILQKAGINPQKLKGIIVYAGPGSFTGLRIGFAVVNAMADQLKIPNVAASGDDWIKHGLKLLENTENPQILVPNYGGSANITLPRK